MNGFTEVALNWFLVWEPEYNRTNNVQLLKNLCESLALYSEEVGVRHFGLSLLVHGSWCSDRDIFSTSQLQFFDRLFQHGYSHANGWYWWALPDVSDEVLSFLVGSSDDGSEIPF